MTPAVSVLLPCFDAESTLAEAMESVLAQSYRDFEVVAVDDGSTDGTWRMLERYRERDARVRVLDKAHGGVAEALAFGFERCRAPLVARMDADDRAHPRRLERQVSHLQDHPETDVLGTRVRLFPRESLGDGYRRYEDWVNQSLSHEEIVRSLFVESPLPHPSVLLRRAAVDAVGGYRDAGWAEDYDLWMRLWIAGRRFEKLPEVLLDWRDGPHRTSRTHAAYRREAFDQAKLHYLPHFLPGGRPLAVWGAGPIGKKLSRDLAERDLRPERFVEVDPRKVGQQIQGLPVVDAADAEAWAGCFVVVAVGALSSASVEAGAWRSARDDIRDRLDALGYVELADYLCLA